MFVLARIFRAVYSSEGASAVSGKESPCVIPRKGHEYCPPNVTLGSDELEHGIGGGFFLPIIRFYVVIDLACALGAMMKNG